jgi:cysteine synthase
MPAAALDYFRALGKRHGASGGKTAAANMTAAQRKARAVKASQAAAVARMKRAKAR